MSDARSKKKQEQAQEKIVMEILGRPENANCADCNTRGPRWAAVNIGCFICIRCAGLHRKLGTQVSKIKSCSLDTWSPEMLSFCSSMGNEKVNEIYLSKRNAPMPNTGSDGDMEIYIKNKYERKAYCDDRSVGNAPRNNNVSINTQNQDTQSQASGMATLRSMGFMVDSSNQVALSKSNGDIQSAIEILLSTSPSRQNNQQAPPHSKDLFVTKQVQQVSNISRFPESILEKLRSQGFSNLEENENALLITNGNIEKAILVLQEWKKNKPTSGAGGGSVRSTGKKQENSKQSKPVDLFASVDDDYGNFAASAPPSAANPSNGQRVAIASQQLDIFGGPAQPNQNFQQDIFEGMSQPSGQHQIQQHQPNTGTNVFQAQQQQPQTNIFQAQQQQPQANIFQAQQQLPQANIFQAQQQQPQANIFQAQQQQPQAKIFQAQQQQPQANIFQAQQQQPQANIFQAQPQQPQANIFQAQQQQPQTNIFQAQPQQPQANIFQAQQQQTFPPMQVQQQKNESPINAIKSLMQSQPYNQGAASGGNTFGQSGNYPVQKQQNLRNDNPFGQGFSMQQQPITNNQPQYGQNGLSQQLPTQFQQQQPFQQQNANPFGQLKNQTQSSQNPFGQMPNTNGFQPSMQLSGMQAQSFAPGQQVGNGFGQQNQTGYGQNSQYGLGQQLGNLQTMPRNGMNNSASDIFNTQIQKPTQVDRKKDIFADLDFLK